VAKAERSGNYILYNFQGVLLIMNRIKRLIFLAVMLLLIVGVASVRSSKAATTVAFVDGFWDLGANLAVNRWQCEVYWSNVECWVSTNSTYGRTDSSGAKLHIWDALDQSHWVGVGRTVELRPPAGTTRATSCQASLWVRNLSYNAILTNTHRQGPGQIEIINPSTWSYITIRSFKFAYDNWNNWTLLTTNWFTPPGGSIYLRLVAYPANDNLGNTTINQRAETILTADDMTVTCNFS
jgi:hypothetical protein